ncbi:hypothetical protein AG1IA_10226 [Rhizoctonia solani AG-1 IA]|uniref:Secreted protein n=1 Tax=Thanatephorus cucumeris (strain AG1-IA) TaxID=983506 RepID=L8WH93_THACA|nr:hypothetical protein AG1IA_10226 [Rhizoctonia solani AG-1 IA]
MPASQTAAWWLAFCSLSLMGKIPACASTVLVGAVWRALVIARATILCADCRRGFEAILDVTYPFNHVCPFRGLPQYRRALLSPGEFSVENNP